MSIETFGSGDWRQGLYCCVCVGLDVAWRLCISCDVSDLLPGTVPEIFHNFLLVSQGCVGGLLGRDPFSISDLSSGTLFLCQASHVTLFQVKTENPPLLFCLLIYHFLSSVSIKPMTTMLVFLRCLWQTHQPCHHQEN